MAQQPQNTDKDTVTFSNNYEQLLLTVLLMKRKLTQFFTQMSPTFKHRIQQMKELNRTFTDVDKICNSFMDLHTQTCKTSGELLHFLHFQRKDGDLNHLINQINKRKEKELTEEEYKSLLNTRVQVQEIFLETAMIFKGACPSQLLYYFNEIKKLEERAKARHVWDEKTIQEEQLQFLFSEEPMQSILVSEQLGMNYVNALSALQFYFKLFKVHNNITQEGDFAKGERHISFDIFEQADKNKEQKGIEVRLYEVKSNQNLMLSIRNVKDSRATEIVLRGTESCLSIDEMWKILECFFVINFIHN